jgi:hypothetical protein
MAASQNPHCCRCCFRMHHCWPVAAAGSKRLQGDKIPWLLRAGGYTGSEPAPKEPAPHHVEPSLQIIVGNVCCVHSRFGTLAAASVRHGAALRGWLAAALLAARWRRAPPARVHAAVWVLLQHGCPLPLLGQAPEVGPRHAAPSRLQLAAVGSDVLLMMGCRHSSRRASLASAPPGLGRARGAWALGLALFWCSNNY